MNDSVRADISGSREPDPSFTGSGPAGVDPGRFDFSRCTQFFVLRGNDRDLLRINLTDGTVEGEVEDASEAARVFIEYLRTMLAAQVRSGKEPA